MNEKVLLYILFYFEAYHVIKLTTTAIFSALCYLDYLAYYVRILRIEIIGNFAFLRLTQFLILSLAMLTSGHDGPLAKISIRHQTLGLYTKFQSGYAHIFT